MVTKVDVEESLVSIAVPSNELRFTVAREVLKTVCGCSICMGKHYLIG